MWSSCTEGAASSIHMDVADISGTGPYVIHEASPDLFSDNETQSFPDYADAAIVTFSRSGSESSDVPHAYAESYLEAMDVKGRSGDCHADAPDSESGLGSHYLELTSNEKALLSYVAGKFDRAIVLVNSGNAMELSFLDDETYGVDACLWIGNPGQDGLYEVGDILSGAVSPSGRTIDTYAYGSSTSATSTARRATRTAFSARAMSLQLWVPRKAQATGAMPALSSPHSALASPTPRSNYAWCSEVLISSTWNDACAKTIGEQIGEDCLAQGDLNFAGWYAPSMNIHRTPFSGRNFEYCSEDGFLSGCFGAATVAGACSRSVMAFVKRFALNDQETMRSRIATLSNEQAIRETYLAAFEPSISYGDEGTLGIMLSVNRVGLRWSCDCRNLIGNVVRGEWEFDGMIVTDQASYPKSFPLLAIRAGLAGGIDLWLNSRTDSWEIDGYASNPTVMAQLRQASKHILYAASRSLAMNGISSTTRVVHTMPMWQKTLVGGRYRGWCGSGIWRPHHRAQSAEELC